MLFCCPGMCPRCLLFLGLQWKTCGIQLLGLHGGKWGSCWRPARPQDGMTPPHVVLKLRSAITHCSLHRNGAVISLLDCSGYSFHFVVSQRPQPLSDLQFCGCPTKGLGSHANSLFYYFRFQHHPTDRFQLHNGTFILAPYLSDPEEARISVTDKNRKNKILRNVTSTKSIFLIDWSS